MSSPIREMSFIIAPVLLMCSLAQGQIERYQMSLLSPSPSPVVDQTPPATSNNVPNSENKDTSLALDSNNLTQQNQPPESNPASLDPNPTNRSVYSSNATDYGGLSSQSFSPPEEQGNSSGSSDANSEDDREYEKDAATFFAFMKKRKYAEADRVLKKMEERAQNSGNEQKITMTEGLRQNLDALRP